MSKTAAARAMIQDVSEPVPELVKDEISQALHPLLPQGPPQAPTEEQWAAMSPEQRRRVVDSLPAGRLAEEIDRLADGDWHFDAKVDALDTLRRYFSRTGRQIYLASERRVYYPGQRSFIPDLLAVLDVDPKKRTKWVVSQERKGLDLVLEILHHGDRKKDLEDNVTFYAMLGIREYFIYDCGQQMLWGHWLPSQGATRYATVRSLGGRYPSVVLGLDLAVEDVQLRFYHGTAELAGSSDIIHKLENLVEEVQTKRRADADELRQTQEQLLVNARRSILTVLEVRGLAVSEAVQTWLQACEDSSLLQDALRLAMTCATADELVGSAPPAQSQSPK